MTALTWETVDAIAVELGATAAQRRKWRQTGRQVPNGWRIRIAEKMRASGQPVAFEAFDDLPPRPGKLCVHNGDTCPPAAAPAPGKRNSHSRTTERKQNNG